MIGQYCDTCGDLRRGVDYDADDGLCSSCRIAERMRREDAGLCITTKGVALMDRVKEAEARGDAAAVEAIWAEVDL